MISQKALLSILCLIAMSMACRTNLVAEDNTVTTATQNGLDNPHNYSTPAVKRQNNHAVTISVHDENLLPAMPRQAPPVSESPLNAKWFKTSPKNNATEGWLWDKELIKRLKEKTPDDDFKAKLATLPAFKKAFESDPAFKQAWDNDLNHVYMIDYNVKLKGGRHPGLMTFVATNDVLFLPGKPDEKYFSDVMNIMINEHFTIKENPQTEDDKKKTKDMQDFSNFLVSHFAHELTHSAQRDHDLQVVTGDSLKTIRSMTAKDYNSPEWETLSGHIFTDAKHIAAAELDASTHQLNFTFNDAGLKKGVFSYMNTNVDIYKNATFDVSVPLVLQKEDEEIYKKAVALLSPVEKQ